MCDTKCGCGQHKKVAKKTGKCAPAQVKKCHGPVKKQPRAKK